MFFPGENAIFNKMVIRKDKKNCKTVRALLLPKSYAAKKQKASGKK